MSKQQFQFLFIIVLVVTSCARAPLKDRQQAMRLIEGVAPEFEKLQEQVCRSDGASESESIARALNAVLPWLDARPNATMQMGTRAIARGTYAKAIRRALENHQRGQSWNSIFARDFEWLEVYGRDEYGDILLTSYYAPVLKASHKPQGELVQPIYGVPQDLVELDQDSWRQHTGVDTKVKSLRLVPAIKSPEGDWRPPRLLPYYSRAEIDRMGKLDGKTTILGHVDPVDAFFLHIQGSGKLLFSDNSELHVGYATQNGHPYYSIGKSLWDAIPTENMSMAAIEQHLRSLSPDVRNRLMDLNPSYIFFRPLNDKVAITTSGAAAVAGHSVAVDLSYFPLGMVGWLYFPMPQKNDPHPAPTFPTEPNCGRFVVSHDTGGAIRGADRLDLFWGEGHEAMVMAGAFRHRARLYWLAPKLAP